MMKLEFHFMQSLYLNARTSINSVSICGNEYLYSLKILNNKYIVHADEFALHVLIY